MTVNVQHSEFNRGSPGDFSGKGEQSDGTTWLFPSCSAPTGVPTDRKEDLKAEEAVQGIMQGGSKKGNSSEDDEEIIWPVYVFKNKKHPVMCVCARATYIISFFFYSI